MHHSLHLLKETAAGAIGFFCPGNARPLSNRRLVASLLSMTALLVFLGFRSGWPVSVLLCCSWALAFLTGELSFFQKGSLLFLAVGLVIADSFAVDNIATSRWSSCFENASLIIALGLIYSFCILFCDAFLAALSILAGWLGRRAFKEESHEVFWWPGFRKIWVDRQNQQPLIFRVPRADASNLRPIGFLLFIIWLSLAIVFNSMRLDIPIGAVLWGYEGIVGILTAGLLGLHARLWKPLTYSMLLFAGYNVGTSFGGPFPQIECQPFSTVLLRTALGVTWLGIPFCLAALPDRRGKVFLRGLIFGALATASVFFSMAALRISGKTVDCLPYLAKFRPVFEDRSAASDFWLVEYKLNRCGCWRSKEFQRAYARMILDTSPIGTSRLPFDGWQIKDAEAARLLFVGLIDKHSWGSLFPQARELISNMPEQERPEALRRLLEIYESGRVQEMLGKTQPGQSGFREFAPYLADILAKYDTQCALPELFRLYWDEPGNGIGLSILEVCYKTGRRLSDDRVAQLIYLYRLNDIEQRNQNSGVVDERALLAYLPDVAENADLAKQLIIQSQPGIDEDFFRANHREPFKEWAHHRFDTPGDGAGIDMSLYGLW